MKKTFTKFLAALALLALFIPSMIAVGQTRTIQTASYGFESGDSGWTATSFVNNNTAITAHGGSKYGATNGGSTANVTYNAAVANPQSLTCYYSKTTTNTNAGSHFEIQISTNNSTWTTVASGLGMNEVTKGTWYELTADLSSYSNVYIRVYYTGTSAVRALDDITLTYDDGQSPSTDPQITFNPASVVLDDALVGHQISATFTVSQANLTSGITLSVDNGSLSPSSIAQNADPTAVTWTYTPTTAGAISATVTATSGSTTETLNISGTAFAPVESYDIDFEYATSMYPNWTFSDITTQQTGSITAHGGTYYGTTNGKATASVTTTETVANPGTLTCYISKQSGNTTSSTWYIQVSDDGSTWEDVETHSATSMSQGTWVEFSADLSSYSDVYIRVYYSGSTAIRNIDDLSLTTITPSPAVATTTTINVPAGFNNDLHEGTSAGTLTASVTAEGSAVSSATVTWSSSDTGVATIAANGAVTLVAVGTTTITASYAGVEDQYRPSSDTYELTVVDSYAPGTQNNPYTVAQARAAIDAGTGITGVYATGIISQVDSYNSTYHSITYWISADGETSSDQLEVYSGRGLNDTDFTAITDVEVGAEVVVYGTLKKYSDTYEFDKNNYLTSYTAPQHDVEAPTFNPVAGTYATAQTVSMSTTTSGAAIYYTTDGTEPTNASTQYTTALTVSTATTIKAVAYDGTNYSNVTTAIYHINSQANPYTVAQVKDMPAYQLPANGVYVSGIVSQDGTNLSSGALNYYISTDGTTDTELYVFKGKNLNNTAFSATTDIQAGDIVTIYGNIIDYVSGGTTTREFTSGNYLVSFERPVVQYNLTVSTLASNVEGIYVFDANDQSDPLIANGAAGTVQVTSGTSIMVSPDIASGYVLASLTVDGNDVTSQVTGGEYTFTMPTHAVTISATAAEAPTPNTYTLATSITSGKQYIIVGIADSKYYAMGYYKSSNNNRHAVEISSDGTTATAVIDNTQTNAHEFTITSLGGGYYSIMDETTSGGYLYASSDSKNRLDTENVLDENHNGDWKITINSETGVASVIADQSSNRNVMQFNNQNILFSCYASASQHPVYLYVKDEAPTPQNFTLDIDQYTSGQNNGWYLIASPVAVDLASNTMVSGTYDLYRFNPTADLEWENYKNTEHSDFTTLVVGRGYLYANGNNGGIQLSFTGVPENNGEVTAVYTGWNLVGNPLSTAATVDRAYYRMNTTHTGIMTDAGTGNVAVMEGIFVETTENTKTVTFTAASKGVRSNDTESVTLNIMRDGNVIDRAIVRFNSDRQLGKLTLFDDDTKIYIPQNGHDYAIVSSNGEGSMPVNFKAKEMGKYTISVETEGIDLSYLHLIDRLTGEDINLLLDSEYSFIASNSDMESRFILLFNENGINANGNETFAFQNGNEIIVNGEGELQIFDVTGRMVKNTMINGVEAIAMPQGVYIFRLNEKVQKIVVR